MYFVLLDGTLARIMGGFVRMQKTEFQFLNTPPLPAHIEVLGMHCEGHSSWVAALLDDITKAASPLRFVAAHELLY